ncbi:MAG: hypothetical protein ACQEWM_01430 [Actinomycetota bacterium]
MFKKRSALITALLVGGLVAAGAAPASAGVVERYTYEDSFSEVIDDFCGSGLEVAYTYAHTGSATLRTRGDDTQLWYHDRLRIVETFTYDGMTATAIQPNTLIKDQKIVDNGDGTISVTVLVTGGARLVGSDGKLLATDSGQIRLLLTIDVESGETLSEALIFGPTGTNGDYCEALLDHWGV